MNRSDRLVTWLAVLLLPALLGLTLSACPASDDTPPQGDAAMAETPELEPSPIEGIALRRVATNGITLRVAEQGEGPLVLFAHGFPESWYSWRHQIPAVAAAGFRAIAPDMRGYGGSDAPDAIDAYTIPTLCDDLVGLIDFYGESQTVLVGHDWGAAIVWQCSLLHPDRIRAVAAMSVPYRGRSPRHPIEAMRERFGDDFYYMLYFQELDAEGRGLADTEFDADPEALLRRLYASPDTPRQEPTITDPKRAAGGWVGRFGLPTEFPPWFSQQDLDYYVGEFTRVGFRGGINYYRNIGNSWELTPELEGQSVTQPALFLAGEKDSVIAGATREQLEERLGSAVSDLRGVHLFPDAGHWIQQERAEEVNELLLEFLDSLD